MEPGPRTRANRPLPPILGGAGDPGTIAGRGVFAGPEKLDEGVFRSTVAAQIVTETAVEVLKARGEPNNKTYDLTLKLVDLPGLPAPTVKTNAVVVKTTPKMDDDLDEELLLQAAPVSAMTATVAAIPNVDSFRSMPAGSNLWSAR